MIKEVTVNFKQMLPSDQLNNCGNKERHIGLLVITSHFIEYPGALTSKSNEYTTQVTGLQLLTYFTGKHWTLSCILDDNGNQFTAKLSQYVGWFSHVKKVFSGTTRPSIPVYS